MKWRVLLVDDEWLVRRELRAIVNWESLGFTIVGEASNGDAALRLIEELAPHLVILDVQMPVMDGVALSGRISGHDPEIRMLVVSSHDQFEYVKSTMKSGASDYLLKHQLTAANLEPLLKELRRDLELRHRTEQQEKKKEEAWRSAGPSLLRKYVRELALGLRPEPQEWMEDVLYAAKRSALLVVQIVGFHHLTLDKSDKERNEFIESVQEVCQQAAGDLKQGCAVHIDHGRFAVLLGYPSLSSESVIYRELSRLEDKIAETLNLLLNVSVAVQNGGVCLKSRDVHEKYRRACEKLKYLAGMESSASPSFAVSTEPQEGLFTLQHEKRLLAAVIGGDEAAIGRIVAELAEAMAARRSGEAAVQLAVCEMIALARKLVVKSRMEREHPTIERLIEDIGEARQADRTMEGMARLFAHLSRCMQQSEGPGRSAYVQKAVHYIHRHYREEISLDSAARALNLSSAYLSRLFKNEMGIGFVDYTNKVRIEAGVRLLESGEATVKEIYEQVGFKNYSYFFRVFKEVTGQTPQQMMRKKD